MEVSELRDVWVEILKALEPKIPKSKFLTWFQNTALLEKKEGGIVVGVPTEIAFNNLSSLFLDDIREAAKEVAGIEHVRLKVDGTLHKGDDRTVNLAKLKSSIEKKKKTKSTDLDEESASQESTPSYPAEQGGVRLIEGVSSKVLHSKYTLSNFIVGPENQLAHAATCAVVNKPGESYNPLFIYGGVGLGKTHLLQAAGNEILQRNPRAKVVYVTSEKFMNELIQGIGNSKTEEVRKKYRQIDVLIVDDIQFFAGKTQTQVEFFHTFNELYNLKKQVILSSDRPPQELTELESRLKSRFEWGMIADVQFPDFETRCAILKKKCQERGVSIQDNVLEFIAHNVHSSIRELEGVLNQALAMYELQHVTPTITSIGPLLMKLNNKKKIYGYTTEQGAGTGVRRATSVEEVLDVVSRFFGVPSADILAETRKQDVVLARQVAMYIAKADLHMTYEKIGEKIGKRLHSTVMHSCNKLQKVMKKDERLKRDVNSIRMELGLL